MKLYLHIGTEKTGTTAIQNFFRLNRDALRHRGVLYPLALGPANHVALAAACARAGKSGDLRKRFSIVTAAEIDSFRADLLIRLREELSQSNCNFVTMSNEHCSSRLLNDHEVYSLYDLLRSLFEQIVIVVYLRRQDEFLLSTYSTNIKGGLTRELALPPEVQLRNRYNYWHLLSRWSKIFGRENIIVRKYERGVLAGNNIIDDFLRVIDRSQDADLRRPKNTNESLDAAAIAFLKLYNDMVPRSSDPAVELARRRLVVCLAKISHGPKATLPKPELQKFMEQFRATNRQVAIEYFGAEVANSDDPLFSPVPGSESRVLLTPVNFQQAMNVFVSLWAYESVERAADTNIALGSWWEESDVEES